MKQHAVTQYVLYKQHLLETAQAESGLQVVSDIIALHATSASTPYLSLWARMKKFQRSDLDRELYANRNLIRLEVMRGTLFITSTALAPLVFQATRLPAKRLSDWLQQWNIPGSEYQRLEEYVLAGLKGGGKTLQMLKNSIPHGMVRTLERRVGSSLQRMTNVNIVLTVLMRQGRVFSEKFAEPILTRYANRYGLIREVYPQLNLESLTPKEAQIRLIQRYIRTFGPVTEKDIMWWTGFSKSLTQNALTTLAHELHTLRIKKLPDDYLMLETDYAIFRKFKPPRKSGVILLPYEDPYTKGYKNRTRLINAGAEKKAYVGGAVEPTILINGVIAGIWNRVFDEAKEAVTVQLFQRLSKHDKTIIVEKIKVLSELMIRKKIDVEFTTV